MLLPAKHISLAESLLGLGAWILAQLIQPRTIEELWEEWQNTRNTDEFPAYHSYENLVLAIDFLYAINAIEMLDGGEITKCKNLS